ncbi:hypothetical protein ACVW07_002196 [Cellulomonas sp. URHB0016]
MSRRKTITLSVLAVLLVLVTAHLTIHGFDIGSLNPHAR